MTASVPAVVYAAKSTEDRHGSIATQITDCREMAERESWCVVDEQHDEGFSAYRGNRGPGLERAKQRAVQEASSGDACVLVVQHSDRLARGMGDAPGAADHLGELHFWARRHNVRLRSVQDDSNFDDAIRAVLIGERNAEDSRRKSEATRSGKRRQAERGRALGPLADGYKLEISAVSGTVTTRRVPDPERAPLILRIFDLVERGYTFGDVARTLNAEGARTRRGKQWSTRRVRETIQTPVYAGLLVVDGERRSADHEPLIEPERFDAIQATLRRLDPAAVQARKGGRRPREDYMLRGLARCGRCGEALYTRRLAAGRHYLCAAVREARATCDAPPIPAAPVETAAFHHLESFGVRIGEWLQQRAQQRATEHAALVRLVNDERDRLRPHEQLLERAYAQHERLLAAGDELADGALRAALRLEGARDDLVAAVADAQARADEWTPPGEEIDSMVRWFDELAGAVNGRLASAQGVADVRAVLRDLLAGVWIDRRPKKHADPIKLRFVLRADEDQDLPEVLATTFADLGMPSPTSAETERQTFV